MNWRIECSVTAERDTGHGRDSPNPFSATTVQTLHYARRVIERGKKGGMEEENGEEDFIRVDEDGAAATWRIGARLNQQPSTFNPLQEVYKYVQLFLVELHVWYSVFVEHI